MVYAESLSICFTHILARITNSDKFVRDKCHEIIKLEIQNQI